MGALVLLAPACGDDRHTDESMVAIADPCAGVELPYAKDVVGYELGPGGGYGEDKMPQVVLGPPQGRGELAGSTDVLSLGNGGEIVLDLGAAGVTDGVGVDLVVFENPFHDQQGNAAWVELGEVSLSEDLVEWFVFACDVAGTPEGTWPGCAGWSPVLPYDACASPILDPVVTGGDWFDLAELGPSHIRYVRIRALTAEGAAPTVGFDLDAVGYLRR